jgi:hypothetical protein
VPVTVHSSLATRIDHLPPDLYAKTGQRDEAHVELSTAIALSHALEVTFWLP